MESPSPIRNRSPKSILYFPDVPGSPVPPISRRSSFQMAMTGGEDIAATFTEEPFRHTDPKYQCCCNKMHCKLGTRCIFVLGVIAILVNIFMMFFGYTTLTMFIIQAVLVGLAIVAYACMFIAIKKEREVFLLPYIGLMVLNILLLLVTLVISLWSLIEPRSEPARILNNVISDQNQTLVQDGGLHQNQNEIQTVSAVMVALSLLGLVLCIWFAFVVYKYYLYLRDMKRARHPQTIVYHGDMKNTKITELKQ